MQSRADRVAALRGHLTNPDDIQALLEVEQILRRLEAAGQDFQVTNIVSHRTGQGKLDVVWLGQIAQMTPEKARETAWILLESAAVAESEAAVMRFMRERVGVGPDTAAQMLQDFRRYREQDPGSLVGQESH